jgi:hypothetical protein
MPLLIPTTFRTGPAQHPGTRASPTHIETRLALGHCHLYMPDSCPPLARPLHRRAIGVLDLDPIPGGRPVGRGDPLGHYALEPEPAGMSEHHGAVLVGVLIEHDAERCACQQSRGNGAGPCGSPLASRAGFESGPVRRMCEAAHIRQANFGLDDRCMRPMERASDAVILAPNNTSDGGDRFDRLACIARCGGRSRGNW